MSSQKRKFSWLDLFIEPEERERRRKENEEKAEKIAATLTPIIEKTVGAIFKFQDSVKNGAEFFKTSYKANNEYLKKKIEEDKKAEVAKLAAIEEKNRQADKALEEFLEKLKNKKE